MDESQICLVGRPSSGSDAQDTLGALYRLVWRVCAGWNRKPFGQRQLFFIRNRMDVLLMEHPLGSLEAMTTIINDRRVIIVNRALLPRQMKEQELFNLLGSRRGAYLRFVFLHELAHQLFHESPATLRTPWAGARHVQGQSWEVQREVEADFYALLAVVPDSVVFAEVQRTSSRRRVVEAIARRLGFAHALNDAHRACIFELAEYRLALFQTYSSAFVSVSASPFGEAPGRGFRNVRTFDDVAIPAEALLPVDISQILMLHPNVNSRPAIREELRSRGVRPFDHINVSALKPHWRGRPLTYRVDFGKLFARLEIPPTARSSDIRWRTIET